MTWAPVVRYRRPPEQVEIADSTAIRRAGNAIDDGTEPDRAPVDVTLFDHGPAVARVLDASGGTRRDP